MVNIPKLRGKIVEKKMTIGALAKKTGIKKDRLYRRLSGNGEDITIEEASAISAALEFTGSDVNEVFFAKIIA